MNRLRIPVAHRARKLRGVLGMGSGPEGRMQKLRATVTELIRYERLEGSYRVLDESRGYAELVSYIFTPSMKSSVHCTLTLSTVMYLVNYPSHLTNVC